MKMLIVTGSTRQGRATPRVAKWVENIARAQSVDHEWVVADLLSYDLPFFDEPFSPLGNPHREVHGIVKEWLDLLDSADGYVIVTPEYNHGVPAVLKNAIDYVDRQLQRKPVAIISHGVMGGVRSAEQLAQVLRSNVGSIPIPETVYISGPVGDKNLISEEGELMSDSVKGSQIPLENTLRSLLWYTEALKVKREE
jgi:NAD(P)H-dependent FMN reductase